MSLEDCRQIRMSRETTETRIELEINLDGNGNYLMETGIGFFDHMLEQIARHSGFDLTIKAVGDLNVDCHHTVEDVGILLGKAFYQAIGNKKGIRRYGSLLLPMDETLCQVAVDICGRATLVFNCSFEKEKLGDMDTEMIKAFFSAFASNAFISLHLNVLYGENNHHKAECLFKAFGRILGEASRIEGDRILSTKGCI